jgi:hypothetical protein
MPTTEKRGEPLRLRRENRVLREARESTFDGRPFCGLSGGEPNSIAGMRRVARRTDERSEQGRELC